MGRRESEGGELVPGTLDMLILKAVATGPLHGYAIAEWIHDRSRDILRVDEGALYPALHRLELRGMLAAQWGTSENNRRAKYYQLTRAGREHLGAEKERWSRLSSAIGFVMESA